MFNFFGLAFAGCEQRLLPDIGQAAFRVSDWCWLRVAVVLVAVVAVATAVATVR